MSCEIDWTELYGTNIVNLIKFVQKKIRQFIRIRKLDGGSLTLPLAPMLQTSVEL